MRHFKCENLYKQKWYNETWCHSKLGGSLHVLFHRADLTIHKYERVFTRGWAFDCVGHSKLWKILKEMGTPGHLTCLLRHLYAGQEATVRTGHETTDWFQLGKGVCQGCRLSSCLFNLYAEYIMRNAGLEEAQAGIKIAKTNIKSDLQMTPPLWQRAKRN